MAKAALVSSKLRAATLNVGYRAAPSHYVRSWGDVTIL